jgi:Phytanoyl-CoA dioxygenase (PhyH)
MAAVDLKALETRGFVLVPSFLSEAEARGCRDDFASRPVHTNNHNYNLSIASGAALETVLGRVKEMLGEVSASTNLRANLPMGALYFATERGVKFSWHQDHESFFAIQNHYDYLNFYIPVVKPRKDRSNLCVIPFDALEKESTRHYPGLVRGGATRFPRFGNGRMIFHDDTGGVERMRADDLDRIAHAPELSAGDLLLMRGDVIHRTQDAETERVALSFRAASTQSRVSRTRLAAGSLCKARMMANNSTVYDRLFRALDTAGAKELSFGEILQIVARTPVPEPVPPPAFFRYLLREKARERVLLPFIGRTVSTVLADRAVIRDEKRRGV